MRADDRVTLGRRRPPDGYTTRTVAEMLGWSVTRLLALVANGSLPPPDVAGGELVWSMNYALAVRCDGLRLPGTYSGLPPGHTVADELRKWVRVADHGGGTGPQYTARGLKKAAKRKRGGK